MFLCFFCLISLHYVDEINKVMMMMMIIMMMMFTHFDKIRKRDGQTPHDGIGRALHSFARQIAVGFERDA